MTSSFGNRGITTAFGTRSDRTIGEMSDNEFNDFLAQDRRNRDRVNLLGGLSTGANSSSGNGSSNGSSSSSSNSNSSSFGGNIEDISRQARDMAQFRLGLDFQQMDRAAQLREQESSNNFGRTQRLTDQTYNWQRLINQDTEGARTQRNTDSLNTQRQLQDTDIAQQNFNTRRAIGLASRRLGG